MMKSISLKRRKNRGSVLVETTLAFTAVTAITVLLLKASGNATSAQQWTIVQGMTDAYMTKELAVANRIPFEEFKENGSDWPAYPTTSSETIEVGRLPNGVPLTGTVTRTRRADSENLSSAGGNANSTTNPLAMEAWKLESYLVYNIGEEQYVKSRTTLRVR